MVENCCPLSKLPLLRLQATVSGDGSCPPDMALDSPQRGKQLTKDCFSAGCDLPEMPRRNVGNHLAGTNLVFGHRVGQMVSQGRIGLIMPSPPWKKTSKTADTDGSIRAKLSFVTTGVNHPNLSFYFGHA